MIRTFALVAALLATAPATAKDDVPLSPIGLPFGPGTPHRVAAGHPLFGAITVAGVAALPDKLGPAKRDKFVAALTETLDRLGMLATDPAKARFRLTPAWIGLESPFHIGMTSKATARMGWRVDRIDSGKTIFAREIATFAESSGGSAYERKTGVERVALMSNIASAVGCIDKTSLGQPPADCALTPGFSYRAPNPPLIIFMPR